MKYSNTNNSPHPRKQVTTISSTVVRCICVTASCIVTACGLLGLGATCFLIKLTDPSAAPCPSMVIIIVFGVSGLLFLFSFLFLLVLCRRRNRISRKVKLGDLPVSCEVEQPKKSEEEQTEEEQVKTESADTEEHHSSNENFEMTQKSADVSLWIEQQESEEVAVDCYPLENTEDAASHDAEGENSEVEITPL